MLAAAAGNDVDKVAGQTVERFVGGEFASRTSESGGGVDVRTSGALGLVTGVGSRRESMRGGKRRRNKQILEVGATLVSHQRGKREDVRKFGVRLDEMKVLQNDVFDGYVVGVKREGKYRSVRGGFGIFGA